MNAASAPNARRGRQGHGILYAKPGLPEESTPNTLVVYYRKQRVVWAYLMVAERHKLWVR